MSLSLLMRLGGPLPSCLEVTAGAWPKVPDSLQLYPSWPASSPVLDTAAENWDIVETCVSSWMDFYLIFSFLEKTENPWLGQTGGSKKENCLKTSDASPSPGVKFRKRSCQFIKIDEII